MKVLPLIKKLNRSIVPVGTEDTGILYLEKRWCRTVGERQALDETELRQNKGQFLLIKLAGKIAEDRKIKLEKAYEYIFPQEGTQVEEEFNVMLEYPDEMQELINLRSQTNRLKDEVATVMISGRVAYPVMLAKNAGFKTKTLHVQPLSFPLKEGDRVKFGSCIVEARDSYQLETEAISVAAVTENLAAGVIGYLLEPGSNQERLGDQWTMEDTKRLPETLIEEIYAFYQRESGGVDEPAPGKEEQTIEATKALEETQNSKTLSSLPTSNPPTGLNSTSNVSRTESPIPI